MNEEIFIKQKENLIRFLNEKLKETENRSLKKTIEILSFYDFSNRLEQKGTLTHFIIDSSELDYSIGEKIIGFDNYIS